MFGRPRFDLDLLARVRQAGLLRGELAVAASFGEASQRAASGERSMAVADARRMESLDALPAFARLTAARVATIGAWLGAVPVAVADSALHRAEALKLSPSGDDERVELPWLVGLGAVVRGDSGGMAAASRTLRGDTTHAAQLAARSLLGLWLDRRNVAAGADTLIAVSDEAIRTGRQDGGFSLVSEAVDRLVVARALRRCGKPAAAGRYPMWTDAFLLEQSRYAVRFPLASLVEYERGVALHESGNREGALARLRRFVDHYDQPPAAHRGLVEDAQKRIRELESLDTKSVKQVPRQD